MVGTEKGSLARLVSLSTCGTLSRLVWEELTLCWLICSARDSVLLRTAYKSPSSVHVFSSSTDNTTLFPSIPPPADGTIRVQTDLFGWSIEALSPTTTQITLLDQSDPKGWSSKSSWTPQSLIQAVAGVRDYSLKNGAPPVVTRLGGRPQDVGGIRSGSVELACRVRADRALQYERGICGR